MFMRRIILLTMILVFLCVPGVVFADDIDWIRFPDQKNIANNKSLTMKFKEPLDPATVTSKSVIAENIGYGTFEVKFSLSRDKKTITVRPVKKYEDGAYCDISTLGLKYATGQEVYAELYFSVKKSKAQLQIEKYRAMKYEHDPKYITTIGSRIQNVQLEIKIHKLGCEPDEMFYDMVQSEMFPEESTLTYNGKKFQMICLEILDGALTDKEANTELDTLYYSIYGKSNPAMCGFFIWEDIS